MSKRFAWLFGVVVLVAIGLLVACGTKYSSSSSGLVLVGSQGSAVIQTFSFGLNNGHISGVSNPPATNGQPSAMVLDPAGAHVFVLINQSSIATFTVKTDGTVTASGSAVGFNPETVTIQGTASQEQVPAVPSTFAMDAAGKFLFVADRATTDGAGLNVPGAVSVFSISNGSLTEVANSPFLSVPAVAATQPAADIAAVAATPTVFPAPVNGVQQAVCSSSVSNPPTSEFLYAADSVNNVVWEFSVDTSSGVLTNPPNQSSVPSFAAGSVPSGVTVDACDRFVYVSNNQSNNISAFTICSAVTQSCPNADGSLHPVTGSPFSLPGGANGPGPLLVDPFGNFLYVLDLLSNQVSTFKISPVSGSLTPGSPAAVQTGIEPKSMAIRSDDNWLFVANFQSGSLSQFSITPATGTLNQLQPTITDNQPFGVAVK